MPEPRCTAVGAFCAWQTMYELPASRPTRTAAPNTPSRPIHAPIGSWLGSNVNWQKLGCVGEVTVGAAGGVLSRYATPVRTFLSTTQYTSISSPSVLAAITPVLGSERSPRVNSPTKTPVLDPVSTNSKRIPSGSVFAVRTLTAVASTSGLASFPAATTKYRLPLLAVDGPSTRNDLTLSGCRHANGTSSVDGAPSFAPPSSARA